MNRLLNTIICLLIFSASPLTGGPNQTDQVSPVFPEDSLPFSLELDVAPFSLPTGLQAFAGAIYDGKWILLSGRTNGLHDFSNVGNNFPPVFQNTTVYVIDPATGSSISRSLTDSSSGLTQTEIDILSTTASENVQQGETLYIIGGYGINTLTGQMDTKSTLTALNLKKLLQWVETGTPSVKKAMRQVSDPYLQVTGGFLYQASPHDPFLLLVGQNFQGLYRAGSNGIYTEQVRSFWLNDDGKNLSIIPNPSIATNPDYRRRDLNVVPVMFNNEPRYVILSGVFTEEGGIWTVPITVSAEGSSFEPNPNDPSTFKQAMNNYNCPFIGAYSTNTRDMYVILPGGLSYGFFQGGVIQFDEEIPFVNQVTTIKIDRRNNYSQYIMNAEYPVIISTGSNPGNQLLFGTESQFFPIDGLATYANGVVQLDQIKAPTIIGYIVGGIMSTVPNTNSPADSTSSPYVFTVKLIPR